MEERVIGHYRVMELIGAGAMGEVYRARDERLGRDVALKLIRSSLSGNADHLRRFELEARAAAALNHPNIVAVYDVGLDDGTPYIVGELLEGSTLRGRLLGGALPVRTTIDYTLQIVHGLIAAHERRIIHRDLKPENLFVTKDGRIKILDFGVAKLQPSSEEGGRTVQDLTTVTKSGAVIGTVAYMSPEQLRGKTIDHRSDIFSMGGIIYEMLTGQRPFRGETEVDTITAVLKESPPEIHLEKAGIPAPLQGIVAHCLEKDPENRFQTARDLKFALETLSTASGARPVRINPSRVKSNILPWTLAGVLLTATAILGIVVLGHEVSQPVYQRVTFEEGTLYAARFTPDYRSIVYSGAWNQKPLQLFTTMGDSHLAQPLNLTDASLLAISRSGELALVVHGLRKQHLKLEKGTLARAPLAGGSPREILTDVSWADYDATGYIAVVHHTAGEDRVEYPIGHVLFESHGWISHLRISPQGDSLAFLNHQTLFDDRGSVWVSDLHGHARNLLSEYDSADGLAWKPDGKEIWFTAATKGYTRRILAVSPAGKLREVLTIPAGMTLHDIAPDGRALVSLDAERLAMAAAARSEKSTDISWHDWDVAKDISPDGKSVLFEDASEAAGPNYAVAIRKLDGTPPVELGEGSTGGLSPDGKWAIAIFTGKPGRVILYPVGPGQAREIPVVGLERIYNGSSRFVSDGKNITINGNEPGHGVRCYLLDLETGKVKAVTPEGTTAAVASPDGKYVISSSPTLSIYPAAGGPPRSIPGATAALIALQWSQDNDVVYVYDQDEMPTPVFKLNIVTGEKTLLQHLQPETAAGLISIAPVVVNRDASLFAYSYYQVLSVLYVISGLK